MKQQNGMILFSVMLILSVLAMLLLSQMQMVLLYYRFTNQLITRHFVFRVLESEVYKRMKSGHWEAACTREGDDANAVLVALKNQQGCPLDIEAQRYNLFIENIGVVACVQAVVKDKLYSTQHWRITIAAAETQQILQLRFATLSKLIPCTGEQRTFIHPGVLSWRYLS